MQYQYSHETLANDLVALPLTIRNPQNEILQSAASLQKPQIRKMLVLVFAVKLQVRSSKYSLQIVLISCSPIQDV